MGSARYTALDQGHFIEEVRGDGEVIVLQDGSRWDVYPGFLFRTREWRPEEMIRVKRSKSDEYPYKLINIHRNESVEVRPIRQPR